MKSWHQISLPLTVLLPLVFTANVIVSTIVWFVALILSRVAKQLLAMDRYERRALLRRKVALRVLDDMRRSDPFDCK